MFSIRIVGLLRSSTVPELYHLNAVALFDGLEALALAYFSCFDISFLSWEIDFSSFFPHLSYLTNSPVRIRRKTVRCLNCGHTLGEIYNYCPHCGQENNDNNVSFGTFIHEFFANYLSFDTRIGRSIVPFFFKPGFLTKEFNAGKRMRYVHPLRLYLIVSLVFFFLASLDTNIELGTDATKFGEGFGMAFIDVDLDSVQVDSTLYPVKEIVLNKSLSDKEVLDSLKKMGADSLLTVSGWGGERLFSQGRRLHRLGPALFMSTLLGNLPLVLLIAIPIFALLLKLLYIRQKKLYVQHLVHTLHLHAFTLALFSLVTLIALIDTTNASEDYVEGTALILLFIYTLVSFRSVYQQKWVKTLFKLFLLNGIYLFVLIAVVLLEVLFSFMIF